MDETTFLLSDFKMKNGGINSKYDLFLLYQSIYLKNEKWHFASGFEISFHLINKAQKNQF